MIKDLILKNRSYRRFYEDEPITQETMLSLVDLARLTASSANLQPLRYLISCDTAMNALIFPHLRWAGYLKDWRGPAVGERPAGYIFILLDTSVSKTSNCDHGIAGQSILLGAAEAGLGGCIIASIDHQAMVEVVGLAPQYEILLVLSLGRPKEQVVIETLAPGGDVRYWRDGQGVHYVPKRRLEDIIVEPRRI
ncbi:MAG: nitroreductase [Deltaproteobacteria bacterium RIFCSPLOWO2_02_FULL_53_8]|nr:MAG: nitroreductase [Deltaproteobacteria bacterium RIFCSPLOWO2_02_FULL_53_8]